MTKKIITALLMLCTASFAHAMHLSPKIVITVDNRKIDVSRVHLTTLNDIIKAHQEQTNSSNLIKKEKMKELSIKVKGKTLHTYNLDEKTRKAIIKAFQFQATYEPGTYKE